MALTVAQLVARLTADTSGFYRGMALANSSMIRTGSIVSRVAAGAGLAVAGMGILSLRSAGDFEESMNILTAVTNANTQQTKQMSDAALKLGKDMKLPKVSARDAADAMVELGKAGFSVQKTIDATRGSLQLGVAANLDFASAAKLNAQALAAFDLDGTQATRIANLFAAGANRSTAEIEDLALGLQNAGAQFHGAGYSAETLVASLALLSKNALGGEYAGTALKTMLIRLQSPTDKAAKVMRNFGIELSDGHGTLKKLPAVVKEFQDGLGGLTDIQREQALTTIFGVRANQAMRILMNEGAATVAKYTKEVTGTNDAQRIAEARTKGFNGALDNLMSVTSTLATELGIAMLPAATAVARAMAKFIGEINPERVIAFFTAISNAVKFIASLISHSEIAKGVLVGLLAGLVAFTVVTGIAGAVATGIGLIGAALTALTASPVILVIAALVALGAGLYYAYTHSEAFKEKVDAVFKWLQATVPPIAKQVTQAVIAAFEYLRVTVPPILESIKQYIVTTWNSLKTIATTFWSWFGDYIKAVLGIVKTLVIADFNVIKGIIQTVMALIRGDWQGAWNGIKSILSTVLGAMVEVTKRVLTTLVPAVLAIALRAGKAIVTGILSGLGSIASWLGAKLLEIPGAILAVHSAAYSAAFDVGKAIVTGIVAGLGNIAGAIKDKISSGISAGIHAAGGILHGSGEFQATKHLIGKPLAEGVVLGWLEGIAQLPEKISDSLKNALEAGKRAVDANKALVTSSFSQMVSDIDSAFDGMTASFQTKSEKALAAIVSKEQKAQLDERLAGAKESLAKHKREIEDTLAEIAQITQQIATNSSAEEPVDATDMQQRLRDQNQKVFDLQNQAKDDLRTIEDAKLEIKKAKLAVSAENERKEYEAARALQKRHLDAQLANLQEALLKHPEAYKQINAKIDALLDSYGITMKASGKALGMAFAIGMRESHASVVAAATTLAEAIAHILKLRSPARSGPLASLDTWWEAFVPTLTTGLDLSRLTQGAQAALAAAQPFGGVAPYMGGSGASVGAGPATINYITVEGSLIREQELNDRIRQGVLSEASRGRYISP